VEDKAIAKFACAILSIQWSKRAVKEVPTQGDRKGRPYQTTDRLTKVVSSRGGASLNL